MDKLAIVPLGQVESPKLIGGKARALSQLIREGINIPPGFVITTAVFESMNEELKAAILLSFDSLESKMAAVRSSAAAEDGKNAAWPGQLDSFLKVRRNNLIVSIERCWASADSARARAYAKEKGLAKIGPVAVIVQKMIHGSASGVAFSVHPITQDKNQMIIEAVPGLAESLVSGSATPDSYIIDKRNGDIIKESLQHRRLLSAKELQELTQAVSGLEKFFGFPVDVEWTFLKDKLFILQSRPITTLG